MKKVDTNKYTKLTLSLERIREVIITELPHNGHRFVVLYDDKNLISRVIYKRFWKMIP